MAVKHPPPLLTTTNCFVLDPGGWRGRGNRALYRTGRFLFSVLFSTLWRRSVIGQDNVPPRGPTILAANHASLADPPLVGSSLHRPVYFMAKEELFRVPILGFLIKRVNAFPIRRKEGDVGAFRTAQEILNSGGALTVFPEGRRQRNGRMGRPRAGVALLAAKTGAPVVPVYVHNTNKLFHFPRLTVLFGSPLRIGENENHETFAHRIMEQIGKLKETYFGPTH